MHPDATLPAYVPDTSQGLLGIAPNRYLLVRTFLPAAAVAMVFLLVFGLAGGWILAGRMPAPLTRITDAARMAGTGSLCHRIRMRGRQDEFRELSDAFDSMLERLDSHVAEQRRITLDVTGGAARTSGSAELLLRMVTNLVQNAVVHNLPAGGLRVTVRLSPVHPANRGEPERPSPPLVRGRVSVPRARLKAYQARERTLP